MRKISSRIKNIAENLRKLNRTRLFRAKSPERGYIRFARTPVRLIYRATTPRVIHHFYRPNTPRAASPKRASTPILVSPPIGSTPYIKKKARQLGFEMTDEEARRQRAELNRLKERVGQE